MAALLEDRPALDAAREALLARAAQFYEGWVVHSPAKGPAPPGAGPGMGLLAGHGASAGAGEVCVWGVGLWLVLEQWMSS